MYIYINSLCNTLKQARVIILNFSVLRSTWFKGTLRTEDDDDRFLCSIRDNIIHLMSDPKGNS